jgi:excinuclease ABC subunit B
MAPEDRNRFLAELEERMRDAARKFDFEKAAQIRDRIKAVRAKSIGAAV